MEASSRKQFWMLTGILALLGITVLVPLFVEQSRLIKQRTDVLAPMFIGGFGPSISDPKSLSYKFFNQLGFGVGATEIEQLDIPFPSDDPRADAYDWECPLTKDQQEELDRVKLLFPEANVRGISIPREDYKIMYRWKPPNSRTKP